MFLRTSFLFLLIGKLMVLSAQDNLFPDRNASFPGGFVLLDNEIQKLIQKPNRFTQTDKPGKFLVFFTVDTTGYILRESVQVAFGDPDEYKREAERIIKSIKQQWIPAMHKGALVNQQIAVWFYFNPDIVRQQKYFGFPKLVNRPVETVVVDKPVKAKSPAWSLYLDEALEQELMKVSPGDTVQVLGWAPSVLFVKYGKWYGYISKLAVKVTPVINELLKIIEDTSASEEALIASLNDSLNYDVKKDVEYDAFLRLELSSKSITIGECFVARLNFYFAESNKAPLHWYRISEQLMNLLATDFEMPNGWRSISFIDEIEGYPATVNGKKYFRYTLIEAAYCPWKSGMVCFQPMQLELSKTPEYLGAYPVQFETIKLCVNVVTLPTGVSVTSTNEYKMVGNFMLRDSLWSSDLRNNTEIGYSITLEGKGLTFPNFPPVLRADGVKTKFVSFDHKDTIVENEYKSILRWDYILKFEKEGGTRITIADPFRFYNPILRKSSVLSINRNLFIEKGPSVIKTSSADLKYSKIIAIDISKSMLIADYDPNRLRVAIEGVASFLSSYNKCDIRVLIFAGKAQLLDLTDDSGCIVIDKLKDLEPELLPSGTAIGEAIHLSNMLLKGNQNDPKLIIIGDGDNTAGLISPFLATQQASRNSIVIHSIGLGHLGKVPYGKDSNGNPYMIENTFSDEHLKMVAKTSGGKYFWGRDADSVAEILSELLLN